MAQGVTERKNACELLSLKEVSEILEVDVNALNLEDMSFGGDKSICYYFTESGNRKFFIRLSWKNENAIKNRVLERNYKRYLETGAKDKSNYIEIESTPNHQLIYGIETERGNKTMQILRKRFGNESEIQIELTKEFRDKAVKDQLISLMSRL
jgi:hypothetical protein